MAELSKAYQPADVEEQWYARWQEAGLFTAHAGSPKPPGSPSTSSGTSIVEPVGQFSSMNSEGTQSPARPSPPTKTTKVIAESSRHNFMRTRATRNCRTSADVRQIVEGNSCCTSTPRVS